MTSLEREYLLKAFDSGWLTQNGEAVFEMESNIKLHINRNSILKPKEVSSCSNGSTALHLALLSLDLGPQDEVIVPNFSYIAPVNAVLLSGATPKILDIDPNSWCLSESNIEKNISENTKAIISVDNYGNVPEMTSIREKFPEIVIIQDAAESFPGVNTKENYYGDIITFSFYANKIFTSGEGGAIAGSPEVIERVKYLKNQNVERKGEFKHRDIGFNYRITNLQAAIFNAQWNRRDQIMSKRMEIFSNYEKILNLNPLVHNANFNANPWLVTIELVNGYSTKIREKFTENRIETRPGFTPLSKHPWVVKKSMIEEQIIHSVNLSQNIISLPTFEDLDKRSIEKICKVLE